MLGKTCFSKFKVFWSRIIFHAVAFFGMTSVGTHMEGKHYDNGKIVFFPDGETTSDESIDCTRT